MIIYVVVVCHVTFVAIGHGFRVVEEILAFGNRLRSMHYREFNYLKLCRPAYFVRTTQLLPHPGHVNIVANERRKLKKFEQMVVSCVLALQV